jgi:hypothetical protein
MMAIVENSAMNPQRALELLRPRLAPLMTREGTKPSENVEVATADARGWVAQARAEALTDATRDWAPLLAAADELELARLALLAADEAFSSREGEVGYARRNQLRTEARLVLRVCTQHVARHFGDAIAATRTRLVIGNSTGIPHLIADLGVISTELRTLASAVSGGRSGTFATAAARAESLRAQLEGAIRKPQWPLENRAARRLRNAAWMHFSAARHQFKHELFVLFAFEPSRRRAYKSTPRRPGRAKDAAAEE